MEDNWLVRANKRSCGNKTLYAFMRTVTCNGWAIATFSDFLNLFLLIYEITVELCRDGSAEQFMG